MRRIAVEGEERPLKDYLSKAFPLASADALRRALANRDVKRSGARLDAGDIVCPGDQLEVYIADEHLLARLIVLYEDGDMLAVHKPRGLLSVGETGETSMESCLQLAYTGARACHRLDSATCGLLLFSLNDAAHEGLLSAFRDRSVGKTYRCLVKGTPWPSEAVLDSFLRKDSAAARVSVHPRAVPGALPIQTIYRVEQSRGGTSLLSVEIPTGRTHQIRAQMAAIGHPVLGDDLYGDRAFNRQVKARRLALQAVELRLPGGIVIRDRIEDELRGE